MDLGNQTSADVSVVICSRNVPQDMLYSMFEISDWQQNHRATEDAKMLAEVVRVRPVPFMLYLLLPSQPVVADQGLYGFDSTR